MSAPVSCHDIIAAAAFCKLWLFMIRSGPQETDCAKVQLQWVVAGLEIRWILVGSAWWGLQTRQHPYPGVPEDLDRTFQMCKASYCMECKCETAWPMQALAERKATVVSLSKHPVGFIYSPANIKGMFWICPQMACLVWSKPADIIHKVHNKSRLSKTMATIQIISVLWSHRKVSNMLHIWDHTSQVKGQDITHYLKCLCRWTVYIEWPDNTDSEICGGIICSIVGCE